MSGNGTRPEILTLEALREASTRLVEVPELSKRLGRPVSVRIRAVQRAEWLMTLLPNPPGAETWPEDKELWRARLLEWLESLPVERRLERQRQGAQVPYRLIAAALVEPSVDAEGAKQFASDAETLVRTILEFSGLEDALEMAGFDLKKQPEKKQPETEQKVGVDAA